MAKKGSMTVLGLPAALVAFAKITPAFESSTKDAMVNAGSAIVRDATARVAVDKGDLRAAIGYDIRKNSVIVGIRKVHVPGRGHFGTSTAHEYPHVYGRWIEYGRVNQPARPFMRPAAEAERSRYPERVVEAARNAERDLSVSRVA